MPLNKNKKRSRKVWDETEQEWTFRHGFNKANNDSKESPIMEVGGNDDPSEDPWERLRDAKRGRVEKIMANRMKNEENAGTLPKGAGTLPKGSANRTLKLCELTWSVGRGSFRVPIDLKAWKASTGVARNSTIDCFAW